MTSASSIDLFSRAVIGAVVIGLLTFFVGVVFSYVDAYLIGPPNWKFGRQGEFQLGVYGTFWISVFMVVCYSVSCPIYIVFSKRPAPILFGLFIATSFGVLGATNQLHRMTSLIDFDFGPDSSGISEILVSAFTSVLVTALLCVVVFWTLEFTVRMILGQRRRAT